MKNLTGAYYNEHEPYAAEWLRRLITGRPAKSGIFPLAFDVSARVGRLRAYGNAISPPLAAEVIRAGAEYLALVEAAG